MHAAVRRRSLRPHCGKRGRNVDSYSAVSNPQPSQGLAIAAAALTASGSVVCSLILMFEGASPDTWITPPQEVVESLRCDRLAARDVRMQCKRALAAAKLNSLSRPTQTARR